MLGALISIVSLVLLAALPLLLLVLPLLAFFRVSAARAAVERLERRVAELERRLAGTVSGAAPAAVASPVPASPPVSASPPEATPSGPAPPAADVAAPAPATAPPATGDLHAARPARLETRIGQRWMLYVGVTTLLVGVGLFIRFAFVNAWLTEPVRVAVGALAGALVLRAGWRFASIGHTRFGTTLVGGGLAIWYLTAFAALNLYRLVDVATGFVLLAAVTAAAAWQADRLRSQPLAMVAVIGGFGTPFILGESGDSHLFLFCYTTLLVCGVVFLAHRRDWPALNLASYVLTGMTVLLWHFRFYRSSAYLTTELFFTLYAGLFLWVLYRMHRSTHPRARWVRLALWTTPAWYHLASLAVLSSHWLELLVYFIAATSLGIAVAVRREAMWSRLLLWAVVAGPLLNRTLDLPGSTWAAPAAATWVAIGMVHAGAQIELVRRARAQLHAADVLLIPANGLCLYVGLQAALAPRPSAGLIAGAVAAAYGAVTLLLRRLDARAALHMQVVAVTLAAVAVTALFDGAWSVTLCAVQAGGMIWLGHREQRTWVRAVGAGLLGVAIVRLLDLQFAPVPAAYTVILNQRALLGFAVTGVLAFVAWLHARPGPDDDRGSGVAIGTAVVAANLLMLVTLSTEISAIWDLRAQTPRFASSAELARQMMLSATWGAYAAALTAAGIRRRYPPIRYLAIVVFFVTVVKLFTVDFAQLDSIYRIASSIALGLLLVGSSYLYQRFESRLDVAGAATEEPRPGPPADGS